MQDLRTIEEIEKDEYNIQTSIYDKINWLKILKVIHMIYLYRYHILFFIMILSMLFPQTSGYIVSYIYKNFKKGYVSYQ